jgi:hypothetical protein
MVGMVIMVFMVIINISEYYRVELGQLNTVQVKNPEYPMPPIPIDS